MGKYIKVIEIMIVLKRIKISVIAKKDKVK